MSDGGGLRVWFRDEIENALVGTYAAVMVAQGKQQGDEADGFRKGATLVTAAMCLHFGIEPARVLGRVEGGQVSARRIERTGW